ncbi:hypothetical protein BRM3_08875 [Brachybacterium huguangmaarense]|uniref:Uncharacterized protein n=1 Tax=Brachybacterium huguangmaarense TaxID=1652028 RepID=A0ABY6FXV5_9MICO|nr:hypothetical protein [Brachybacterium huguangmaarense]UYG15757.1 hypothetical protein BRM3_08875 [Brachybacterium huguangmaarense]
MVKRINLRPSPERALADLRRKQLEQVRERDTVPHGVKDMGPTGDSTFIDAAGEKRSVRHFVVELDDTTERAEQLETDLASSVERIAAGETAVAELRDVRLPALEDDLAELDQALADGLGGVSGDLSGLVSDLAAARDQAVSAQQTADAAVQAASAASQAALQAAGIADSKGRVIYSETEPPAADRSSSNLWVKPSDASTRVWVPGQSAWVEVEDSDIKAAAQSAAAANTKAVTAQSTADAAKAAAATAQSTAEAAQRTADKGVLDARDAFNAAVTAQATADQMKSDLAKGPTVWDDPSFERGKGPVPALSNGRIERVQEHATDGAWAIRYTAPGTNGNNFGAYGFVDVIPGHTYMLAASVFSDSGSAWTIQLEAWDKTDARISYPLQASAAITVPNGKLVRPSWTVTAPEGTVRFRYYCAQPTAYNQAANAGQTVYLDELRLVDITDAYPALKAAQDAAGKAQTDATKAQQTADSKATPAQAQAMADAAKTAATTAASADATAKASQAKADALAAAATDAQQKADAAKASAATDAQQKADAAKQAAITAAAADAQAKADAAKAAALAAAAADAKAKADQALADAKADATTKADAAKQAAITAASADATAKAAAAETAAKNAAAADAKTKADQAKADAIAASGTDATQKAEAARQAAVDAARAAADAADALIAQRAAEDASTKANAAKQDAADALAAARGQITSEITASANGKNATRWSTSAASASVPGVVAGDTWMQVDALATRNVKGQWTWDGSAWKPVLIRSEVIAALDVAKLTAGTANIATAVVDKLFANIFSAKKIAAGQIDAEDIAAAVGSFVKINVSQLVATAADLNELVAQKIAAATASIQEAYIQNLRTNGAQIDSAVIAELAATLITSGKFRTDAEGQRLELTSEGLILWGVDPDGAEYEMVRIGPSGTQLLTIGGATIDGDGNAVLQDVEARSLSVDGTSLEDRLAALPQGIIGRGYRSLPWTEIRKSRTRVLELPVTLQPGRTYRVTSSPIPIAGYSKAAWVRGYLEWAPMPVTDVSQFQTLSQCSGLNSAIDRLAPMSRIVTTQDLAAPKGYSFIIRTECPEDYHQVSSEGTRPVELVVEDLGLAIEYTGAAWQDAKEVGSGSGSTPPPATIQRYSLHRDHTAVGTYRRGQNGLKSSGDAVQGQYSSYGNREGLWLFADMTGALSGSTVEKVILNFTISHTYASAGGIAEVRLHGNSSFPSGAAGLNTVVAGVKVRAGGAYSVTITDAAMCAGFRSGAYRGFGLSTDSTNLDHYVRGQNASIDITYRK